ncbi:hypothetical protein [Streptococcus equi]|uniref:hypothetical protein n=1 Tax=Streptococcus equi TaxID=1336 RepID=UPI001E612055|nr:hypothetical protein [Streptococcus equi]MCD3430425.1 hypothetical protein [Streptococcus equi subsp. zooepidemicus]
MVFLLFKSAKSSLMSAYKAGDRSQKEAAFLIALPEYVFKNNGKRAKNESSF